MNYNSHIAVTFSSLIYIPFMKPWELNYTPHLQLELYNSYHSVPWYYRTVKVSVSKFRYNPTCNFLLLRSQPQQIPS